MKKIRYITIVVVLLTASAIESQTGYTGAGENGLIDNAKKHFNFAVQHKNNGNYEESLRQYQKSFSFCDTLYQVHFSYGDLLLKMENWAGARDSFFRAFYLNPGHYDTAKILAQLYYEKGDYDSTLVMYQHMYAGKPDNHALLENIAGLKVYIGRTEDALADYERLVTLGLTSYDNLMKAAKLSFKLGNAEKTSYYADMALEEKPGNISALTLAAQASLSCGELKTAARFYREVAEKDSQNVTILQNLETIYRKLAEHDNLIWTLECRHRLVPEDLSVLADLSELLYARGEMERGIDYVQKGLNIDPNDGRFRILLGESYRTRGENDKALEQYRIALQDDRWKTSAQQLIWQIEPPETEEERLEREFFTKGREK